MPDLDLAEDDGEGLDDGREAGGHDDPVPGPAHGAVDLQHPQGRAQAPDVLENKHMFTFSLLLVLFRFCSFVVFSCSAF